MNRLTRTFKSIPCSPRTQALQSDTFSPPPVDGSLSLLQIYDWHSTHSSAHRLFIFARSDGTIREIYWPEAVSAIHVGAKLVRDTVSLTTSCSQVPIVGVLAFSDIIPYYTIMLSVMRANYVLFPISPRNSAPAVAHLIAQVKVAHILLGRDASMHELLKNAFEILKTQYPQAPLPDVSPIPTFDDLYMPVSDDEVENIRREIPLIRQNPDDIQMYLHSSGSTAFPKPIPWTVQRQIEHCLVPIFGEQDLTNQVIGVHTLPMFHATGSLTLSWTASCGFVLAAFEPQVPAILPTPENAFHGAKATKSDFVFSVPSQLETWSTRPSYVDYLSTRSGVIFSGGPLHKEVGDLLTSQGINVYIIYGSTEAGIVNPVLPKPAGYDWEYFQFSGVVKPKLVPSNDGIAQLIMIDNPYFTPSIVNTNVDEQDAYDTSDLLAEHPTKRGYWKVYGRADSQIVHSSGEKTNPAPLESILNQDPRVAASVMFGHGKFQAGVLVEPKLECRFDPSNLVLLSEFRNKIWPTIERVNAYAPQHSRLFKEMILVASPMKPFTWTAKNTTRAPAILKEYAKEIEQLYRTVDESTQAHISSPTEWDVASVTEFVRQVIRHVLPAARDITDEVDLFQHGCDSLQATWIRNTLLRALRDSAGVDTREATENFVYQNPSIASLSLFLVSVARSGFSNAQDETKVKVENMRKMVEKYSKNFPTPKHPKLASSKTVLISGSTGTFGAHILQSLVLDSSVSKVYALIRSNGLDVGQRQKQAFVERGIDIAILNEPDKVVLLEADLSDQRFGLATDVFEELSGSVTHIIANAWRVDFNLSLRSFERDVSSLRHMVNFALSTGASLVFISSIGIFQNFLAAQQSQPFEEGKVEAVVASGSGYSESKWVSEEIILRAASVGLRSIIVRLGQVCGSANGAWNSKEWLPSIVQSASELGCVPDDDRLVSWIPATIASQALVDFLDVSFNQSDSPRFVHLIHPRPVSWSKLAKIIAFYLKVEVISLPQWFHKLDQAGKLGPGSEKKVPAVKILPFYRDILARFDAFGCEGFAFPKIEIRKALEWSPTLANPSLAQLGKGDTERWLSYWN